MGLRQVKSIGVGRLTSPVFGTSVVIGERKWMKDILLGSLLGHPRWKFYVGNTLLRSGTGDDGGTKFGGTGGWI